MWPKNSFRNRNSNCVFSLSYGFALFRLFHFPFSFICCYFLFLPTFVIHFHKSVDVAHFVVALKWSFYGALKALSLPLFVLFEFWKWMFYYPASHLLLWSVLICTLHWGIENGTLHIEEWQKTKKKNVFTIELDGFEWAIE